MIPHLQRLPLIGLMGKSSLAIQSRFLLPPGEQTSTEGGGMAVEEEDVVVEEDQWAVVDLVAVVEAAATVVPVEATGAVSLVAEVASNVLETGSVPTRRVRT